MCRSKPLTRLSQLYPLVLCLRKLRSPPLRSVASSCDTTTREKPDHSHLGWGSGVCSICSPIISIPLRPLVPRASRRIQRAFSKTTKLFHFPLSKKLKQNKTKQNEGGYSFLKMNFSDFLSTFSTLKPISFKRFLKKSPSFSQRVKVLLLTLNFLQKSLRRYEV